MQVLGSKQNPVPLMAPAICFICEQHPTQQAGERVVDTERTFIPMGPPTRLNGRKYVCVNCVKEMGRLVGMGFDSETEQVRQEFDTYRQSVAILQQRIKDFANDVEHTTQFVPSSSVPQLAQTTAPAEAVTEVQEEPVAEQVTKEEATKKTTKKTEEVK